MSVSVLIIAYNRPDLIGELVDVVVKAKPSSVYCSVDAPIPEDSSSIELNERVKSYLSGYVWPCPVHFRFGDVHQGCHRAVISAIDWFFSCESEGIILEDDCIPDVSYFSFAGYLLNKYRNVPQIGMISGTSLVSAREKSWDYRYSHLVNIWGWATWADRWKQLVHDLKAWPSLRDSGIVDCYGLYASQQARLLDHQATLPAPTWGVRWRFTCLKHGWFSIVPSVNLVKNVGFGRSDAVSKNFEHPLQSIACESVGMPLRAPLIMEVDAALDESVLGFYYNNVPKND